ncbi:MAG: Acetyl-CoA acetyltransferase [Alphaproteobacteria bacterium MarineAlpha3_Bin5]|nr:acetyl-CoA C-acyltransferase [Magnetovibrio sp.]PPR75805.1 MAG: Acetyl-CoA acetyltransferase [Alphaproteobacteria bacterium MarineAlpha3_Bin5]
MLENPVVIVGMARTPIGAFQGALSSATAPELGGVAIKEAVKRAGLQSDEVDDVVMGLCLFAGLKQAPARQAAHEAGIPWEAGCTTLSKMCGSGMKATMIAHDNILAGSHQIMVAGGMESMSNAPYLLPKARNGYRLGHRSVLDHMFIDGLEDAYEEGKLMGSFAEDTAEHYQFTRHAQDSYAIESLNRAITASKDGSFKDEIAPVVIKTKKGEETICTDEQPKLANIEKIFQLKPAFRKNGTVTPANSSSISDGSSALVLMRMSEARKKKIDPIAIIHAHASHSQEPNWFTTAPIGAIRKVLEKSGWNKKEVELFEINEAFAVVAMAAMRDLDIPHDKVNIHGGACALGHPVGATGARIVITLLNALKKYGLKKGVASLCIGGGEGTALSIERIS